MNQTFWATLFDPEEATCFSANHLGTSVFPVTEGAVFKDAEFFSINPLHPTKDLEREGGGPRRADANVVVFRNFLIEMDKIPLEDQKQIINESGLPWSTCVYSAGKSYHFIISLAEPCADREEYNALIYRIQTALGGAKVVDIATKNPSRFSRFPGNLRRDKDKIQALEEVRGRIKKSDLLTWLDEKGIKAATRAPGRAFEGEDGGIPASIGQMRAHALKFFLQMPGSYDGAFNDKLTAATIEAIECGLSQDQIETLTERINGYITDVDKATIAQQFKTKRPRHRNPFYDTANLPSETIMRKNNKGKLEEVVIYPRNKMIEFWLDKTDPEMNLQTGEFVLGDETKNVQSLALVIQTDGQKFGFNYNVKDISFIITEFENKKREEARQRLRSLVKYDSNSSIDPLNDWLRAVMGNKVQEVDLAVMRHFLWQVKRKMWGLPVTDHMMPILYGAQGIGKSVAVEALLRPLKNFWDELKSFKKLEDENHARLFEFNYIIFCDEMSKSFDTNIQTVKNIITSPGTKQRIMFSQGFRFAANNSTLIGASNNQVADLFYDPTGMRRFWQIDCSDAIDWEIINSFDALSVWRAVDEQSPSSVMEYRDIIKQTQEGYRARDTVEQFLHEACDLTDPAAFTSASDLRAAYYQFCNQRGLTGRQTDDKWDRRLEQLGVEKKRTSTHRGYRVKLNDEGSALGTHVLEFTKRLG